jgi:hypothetical protein
MAASAEWMSCILDRRPEHSPKVIGVGKGLGRHILPAGKFEYRFRHESGATMLCIDRLSLSCAGELPAGKRGGVGTTIRIAVCDRCGAPIEEFRQVKCARRAPCELKIAPAFVRRE